MPYTITWDLDDDGEFDDATTITPVTGGDYEAHLQRTFNTPGIYRISARMTDTTGRVITTMQTLTVREPGAAGIAKLTVPTTLQPGVEDYLSVDRPAGVTLSYDLDGDGEFDDTPRLGSRFALTAPATIAVKATAGAKLLGRPQRRADTAGPGALAPSRRSRPTRRSSPATPRRSSLPAS